MTGTASAEAVPSPHRSREAGGPRGDACDVQGRCRAPGAARRRDRRWSRRGPIGKGQQLGLEMGGDEIDVDVLDANAHVQRGSAHGGRVVGWLVALLDRSQLVGKRRHRVKGGWWQPRQDSGADGVGSAGLRRCGLDVPGASNRISKLVGMVTRAQAARRRHRGGQDRALAVAADGPRVRGDESARRRGLSSRRSPSLSSLTTTLPVMAQIDIEYAGRTYTVPWTDDNVERLKGIAQHVRDGRAEVFTVLGDGFALTIVVGPTIPVAITYVD